MMILMKISLNPSFLTSGIFRILVHWHLWPFSRRSAFPTIRRKSTTTAVSIVGRTTYVFIHLGLFPHSSSTTENRCSSQRQARSGQLGCKPRRVRPAERSRPNIMFMFSIPACAPPLPTLSKAENTTTLFRSSSTSKPMWQ